MKFLPRWIPVFCLTMVVACSSDNHVTDNAEQPSGGHVWQTQEDAYKKAQKVEPMIDEADRRQRALLEQQGG
jgi:hypothetical protein